MNDTQHSRRCPAARLLLAAVAMALCMVSCGSDDGYGGQETDRPENRSTLLMYFPWSTDLTSWFRNNISDMKRAIGRAGLSGERVLVFMSTSPGEAVLYEIVCENGVCRDVPVKTYRNPAFTTAGGITGIIRDVVSAAPADTYAMIVGGHGMGWLPVDGTRAGTQAFRPHWDWPSPVQTRYFGGRTSEFQTDIATLAEGIAGAGVRMRFILFDDCFMSSVETAYELRGVADWLVGCPTEIMVYGMPYAEIGEHLLGEPDWQAVCDGFLRFYSSYSYPYGTIGVTCCAELDSLARIMKEINTRYTLDGRRLGGLQRMDGYTPPLFYDYGDYVDSLCPDAALRSRFRSQLERAVPYKAHTPEYYSAIAGRVPVRAYSGINTSAPSINAKAASITETGWHKATH